MIAEIMLMIQVCLITGYQTTAKKTNNFVLARFQVLPTLRMVPTLRIMNQAHAFVAVFEQDSGRSTNTRYLSVLSGSLLLESDFGSAEAKRRR